MACIFTDIIDSTNLWEFDAEQMWEALQQHDALMREEISNWGGFEVKTGGDSFYVVFPHASQALGFCLNAQIQMHQHEWPPRIVAYHEQRENFEETQSATDYKGITVRMGIHFGMPHVAHMNHVTQRIDYYGPSINTSARVQSEAKGGQISVSDDFIREVWRCQTEGMVNTSVPLTDAMRGRILIKEADPQCFELDCKKGLVKMKGLEEKVYITLICYKKQSAA